MVLLLSLIPAVATAGDYLSSAPTHQQLDISGSLTPYTFPNVYYRATTVIPGTTSYLGSNGSYGTVTTFPAPPTYYEPPLQVPSSLHNPIEWPNPPQDHLFDVPR
jgi:hypothetical protein